MKDIIDVMRETASEIFRYSNWDFDIKVTDCFDLGEPAKDISDFQAVNPKYQNVPVSYLGNDRWLVDETDQSRYGCDRGLYSDIYRVESPCNINIYEGSYVCAAGRLYAGDMLVVFPGNCQYDQQLYIFRKNKSKKRYRTSLIRNDNDYGWFWVDSQPRRTCTFRNYRKIFGKRLSDGGHSSHGRRVIPYKEYITDEEYHQELYDNWED